VSLKRAASLGALQSAVSMAAGFLSVKITSVFLGPAGMGVLSQLQYFIAMSQTGVSAGLNTGIVRRTAEEGVGTPGHARTVATVLKLLLMVGLPLAAAMALGSSWLARHLLHDEQLASPVLLFALTYSLGLLALVIVACATGAKDYRASATVNIGMVLSTLALYALLCPLFGLAGGLVGAALVPVATLAIAWAVARRREWWPRHPLSQPFSGSEAARVTAFIPTAAIGAISLPLVQILVRDELARHSGMASVGLLQGVMRISDMYVGLATNVLAMYYLPRFSEIRRAGELRRELVRALALLVPVMVAVSGAIYVLRDLIIHIVLTREFLPMRELFGWQMVGNVLKVVAWLLGALLMAKAHPLALAVFEAATYVIWWQLAVHFIAADGARGATEAYAATYAAYSAVALAAAAVMLRSMRRKEAGVPVLQGETS
jgi:O-antigen/teichoic acid export membrane protein